MSDDLERTARPSAEFQRPKYRRKWRNYLIDVGLQIRYTAFILLVAIFLTAVLGYKIVEAVRDTSKIIAMTGLVDPGTASELEQSFRDNDKVVIWGIIGFGIVLVMSIGGAGIWITHKVAGPLFKIGSICSLVRDNKLFPPLRALRKGDELQLFYGNFRDMHEALRARAVDESRTLAEIIAVFDGNASLGEAGNEAVLRLKRLKADRDSSLDG